MGDPRTLMTWLSELPHRHKTCLECGSGMGEISAFMAQRYSQTIALDINLDNLKDLKKPVYGICGKAEALPFADDSMDLVISMQSLHQFSVKQYINQVKRVLRKGGIFAAFCWGDIRLPVDIGLAYASVFDAVDPYWEETRPWLLKGYEGLEFEGTAISIPSAQMTRMLNLNELDLMIANWSSAKRALKCDADIPDPKTTKRQRQKQQRFPVSWPLLGMVFRV